MNFLGDIYKKSLFETEKNIKYWEEYLLNLKSLDFNVYSDKLTVPILVPIGNKILFRGLLKHTNEVTIALGADYFTKCSTKQAEVLRMHRIKDAQFKLDVYNKEKHYLESQISFNNGIIDDNQGQDIIELCSEDEDKIWRQKHKERVRQYYQNKENKQAEKTEMTDEDLWSRLEELELQEELDNELSDKQEELDGLDDTEYDSFIIKEDDISNVQTNENVNNPEEIARITHHIPKQTSKVNLLQQVMEMQKMLEGKLIELKNKEKVKSRTEEDLLSRLDEMEQLDELEDEMDRLEDLIPEESESIPINTDCSSTKTSRGVSFADQETSETLQINFKHSNVKPCKQPYHQEIGITKPSDIYEAYSSLFTKTTTSILKKSKYDDMTLDSHQIVEEPTKILPYSKSKDDTEMIVVKDVLEKIDYNGNSIQNDQRPISLFKKMRQQRK